MNTAGRVIVVGSLNLDTVYRVGSLPRRGETVPAVRATQGVGGKGGNQAVAAAAAGATTAMIGAVGRDAPGETILSGLRERSVDVGRVRVSAAEPTGEALVVVSDDAENSILVVAGANSDLSPDQVATALTDLTPHDVVLLQNEIPPATTDRAARVAAAAGAHVVWNAAPAPKHRTEFPSRVGTVIVNEGELTSVAACLMLDTTDRTPIDLTVAVARELACEVVCTLGAGGAVHSDGVDTLHQEPPRVEAVDTTAAGDTFTGYWAALARETPATRLAWATAAGAHAVTVSGASSSIPERSVVAPYVLSTVGEPS